jgi:UDP-glucose 4-epimerase
MILLTGGAGYIGSHTALELISQGYDIAILDNFSNSKPSAPDAVRRLAGKDFPVFRGDIADAPTLDAIFKEHPIDAVIHFAALKAAGESVRSPLSFYRNNVCGTLTLLESMNRHDARRIVFSSTAALYGEGNASPYREDTPIFRCANPYGQTKLAAEHMMRDLCASDPSWGAVILRYFNAAGAHESGGIGEDPSGPPANLCPAIA